MTPLVKKLIAGAFVVFLGAVNYVGLRWGSRLQNWTTYLKTGAIGIIVIGVFFFTKGHGNVRNFVEPSSGPFNLPLLGAFGVGLVASLWAYKGWEAATYSAGEVKNPKKNLPLGILIGTISVIVLYILANLAYLYIMPVGKIAASEGRVALDVMQVIGGPFLASLITFLILFSILGAANQNMLTSPRVYFAMARDGMFFKKIAECHPKFLTPHVSIIAITIWSHPADPDRDLQPALHLRHLRRMDLLRHDRRVGHRPAQEAAGPRAALQDLGISGDADHLRSGRDLRRHQRSYRPVQERHGRAADHHHRHPRLLFWRTDRRGIKLSMVGIGLVLRRALPGISCWRRRAESSAADLGVGAIGIIMILADWRWPQGQEGSGSERRAHRA